MTIINMSGGKPAKPVVVEAVEETPSTLPYTFSPREGVDYLSSVTVGKDPNLVPENVKKDVNIFGTVGTLETEGGTVILPRNSDLLTPGPCVPRAWIAGFEPELTPLTEETRPAQVCGGNYWNEVDALVMPEGVLMLYNSDSVQNSSTITSYSFTVPTTVTVTTLANNNTTGWSCLSYMQDGTYSAKLAYGGHDKLITYKSASWFFPADTGWVDGTIVKSGSTYTFTFPENLTGYVGLGTTPAYTCIWILRAERIS